MLWFILVIICALAEAWITDEDNVRMGSWTIAGVAALAMITNIVFIIS